MSDWVDEARETMLGMRSASGGWPYRSASEPCAEPTALAALALLGAIPSCASAQAQARALAAAHTAGEWLARNQNRDGSVGVSQRLTSPGWPTPYAVCLWSALGGYALQRRRAVDWLLEQRGKVVTATIDEAIGHDASLAGWPWVPNTHSWVEPTALAVLALRGQNQDRHERVVEGLRLLVDRAVDSGGWNYGNKAVFGRVLRAQPAPTGLVLTALAGTDTPRAVVERAIDYLLETLPATRSAMTLGWGVIGLKAWRQCPCSAAHWLAESAEQALAHADPVPRLAHLLLAQSDHALGLLGLHGTRHVPTGDESMPTQLVSR